MEDLGTFIEGEKDLMDRWYLRSFGERRPPGRMITLKDGTQERKPFDYPSPSSLWNWLKAYEAADYRMEAFKPRYERCGNRNQLPPEITRILEAAPREYMDLRRPAKIDIYDFVDAKIGELNARRPGKVPLSVSERTVRRRLATLGAFERDAARHGEDYALRKYLPVGKGLDIERPMQRIEMDDWTADLHTLIIGTKEWKKLDPKQRAKVPRCRCTITVAIDVATKCIVGFNVTIDAPSARGSMAAARSIMVDKNHWARAAGTEKDWPMYGRPEQIATDGGPAFQNQDFRMAVRHALTGRVLPDHDPRMRGTVEAFFRGFRRICRLFAGRSFADVVELGDYKAEAMASLTVEQFRRACIVYIVDFYHHRPHRGLEYGTPYAAWKKQAANGLPLPPSRANLRLAFGEAYESTLDKHGVLLFGNSYQSKDVNELLKLQGIGLVRLLADPEDLRDIFVYVQNKEHRHKLSAMGIKNYGGYIEAACEALTDGAGDPVTKEQVEQANAAVRAKAKAESDAGKEARRHATRKLRSLGESTMDTAGHKEAHKWSPERADKLKRTAAPKEQAARGEVEHSSTPVMPTREAFGRVIATSRRSKADSRIPPKQADAPPSPEANGRRPSRSIYQEGKK